MVHLAEFTETEEQLLECWKKFVLQGEHEPKRLDELAAMDLGIAESTVRSRRSRMRSKYESVLAHARKHKSWQQYFFQKTGGKFNPLSRSGKAVKRGKKNAG